MRKLTMLILVLSVGVCICGQSTESGKVIEYQLPGEDCHEGIFYIGKFYTGTYEILANIVGYDANNCGWKIIVVGK